MSKQQHRKKMEKKGKKPVPTNKQLATRINRLRKQGEMKYEDVSNASAISPTGTIIALSTLAQGDNVEERVGEEVTQKYMNMNCFLTHSPDVNPGLVRVIVFWDLQTNAVGPTALASTDPQLGLLDNVIITSPLLSPHNYRCHDRYKVLYDKVWIINPLSSAVLATHHVKKNFNLHNAKIKYGSSNSGVAGIVGRALYCMVIGPTNANLAINMNFRSWFGDL